MHRRTKSLGVAGAAAVALAGGVAVGTSVHTTSASAAPAPVTPIQHVVVIYDENVSFDHYFATYPNAANPAGEPAFTAKPGTATPNNLASANLLAPNNKNSAQPQRIDRADAVTCDHDHTYKGEQLAFDAGAMDHFSGTCGDGSTVVDYYDGNTVTALWNYAQNYAMSDAFFGTTFGPSTPGALNLISGNTHGATTADVANLVENGTVIGDPNPTGDSCGGGTTVSMSGKNIGDLLNTAGVSWGWFQGGFRDCTAAHKNAANGSIADYSAHHEPFQYYASTANPSHTPPASVFEIGNGGPANHQYDLSDFNAVLSAGNMPAVSFLKAPSYEDGHAGYSGPLDEQRFLTTEINAIEQSPNWSNTAVIIAYDDSDGWYDHAFQTPLNSSSATSDQLNGNGVCGPATPPAGGYQDRCGYGPRLPLLVLSPYVDQNTIHKSTLDQTSILRFIEDNWLGGARIGDSSFDAMAGDLRSMFNFNLSGVSLAPRVLADPSTGQVTSVTRSDQPYSTTTTPTPTPTTTMTTPTTTTPKPLPKPQAKRKISAKLVLSARRLRVTFKVSPVFTTSAKVKATLTDAKHRVRGSVRAVLRRRAGKLTLILHLKAKLHKGVYTLLVTLTPPKGAASKARVTLRVRR